MTFPILKPLQPLDTLFYDDSKTLIPEFKLSHATLAAHPDRYRLVDTDEAVASSSQALICRNLYSGTAVLLRHYYSHSKADSSLLIHDNNLQIDGSWDERVEGWLSRLAHGQYYMTLIQGALDPQHSTDLVDYLIYRGVRTYGEIIVPTDELFHVVYRPKKDTISVHAGPEVWLYPGFFYPHA